MIPSRNDWRNWDAMQKVTYVAQLLVPVSLMVTVLFSYLTWRESRIARELEKQLFAAQSAPQVRITGIFFPDTGGGQRPMMLGLKNEGDSTAEAVCVKVTGLFGPATVFWDSCADGSGRLRLRKNEARAVPVLARAPRGVLDFVPARAAIAGLDKPAAPQSAASLCGSLPGDNWVITVSFRDALGKSDSLREVIMVCGPALKS
jgi:hypothetical protein